MNWLNMWKFHLSCALFFFHAQICQILSDTNSKIIDTDEFWIKIDKKFLRISEISYVRLQDMIDSKKWTVLSHISDRYKISCKQLEATIFMVSQLMSFRFLVNNVGLHGYARDWLQRFNWDSTTRILSSPPKHWPWIRVTEIEKREKEEGREKRQRGVLDFSARVYIQRSKNI